MAGLRVNIGLLEVAVDVRDELADALDPNGDGGRRITWREALSIGLAIALGLVRLRGRRGDEAHMADALESVEQLLGGRHG